MFLHKNGLGAVQIQYYASPGGGADGTVGKGALPSINPLFNLENNP